jgi:ABC-type uncharacterized transport system permease subunit
MGDPIGDFAFTIIRASTPLVLATLGEVYAERSGVINLGLEGTMLLGAVGAYAISLLTGNILLGFLVAVMTGITVAIIHGFVSVTLGKNQLLSGISLSLLGLGLSSLIGIALPREALPLTANIQIPILSDLPILGSAIFRQDAVVYFSIVAAFVLWFILFRIKLGVIIKAAGENAAATEAAGINVYLVRYSCVALSGALAGLGGAYLSTVLIRGWVEGMTVGKGWVAVALAAFSTWNPLRALIISYIFGSFEALQFTFQPFGVPSSFLASLPYLIPVFVMVILALRRRKGAPAELGKPYRRE